MVLKVYIFQHGSCRIVDYQYATECYQLTDLTICDDALTCPQEKGIYTLNEVTRVASFLNL